MKQAFVHRHESVAFCHQQEEMCVPFNKIQALDSLETETYFLNRKRFHFQG